MEPVISHGVPLGALNIGDKIIGSDTREYTIQSYGYPDDEGLVPVTCKDDNDNIVTTILDRNSIVDAILVRAQSLSYTEHYAFGIKRCENCEQPRNLSEWDADDYICKICRHLIDSVNALAR
jgi:hypothetical protein